MDKLLEISRLMLPELILIGAACLLLIFGAAKARVLKQISPLIAILSLLAAIIVMFTGVTGSSIQSPDWGGEVRLTPFSDYVKLLAAGVSIVLILLMCPSDEKASGNSSIFYGADVSEYLALALFSISGIMVVAGSNDLVMLFMGIELASIPTYILVAISRPLAVSQEAGVKYFFLGAMAAAVLLFGLSYLYGATGTTDLRAITHLLQSTIGTAPDARVELSAFLTLGAIMIIAGLAFKLAAVPLHFYAADVYHGAATPITALLSFVPKVTGVVALLKVIFVLGGGQWATPDVVAKTLIAMAILTMTVGNVLGLIQTNVKRVMAYSSIAHSGYLLVGLAAIAASYPDLTPGQGAIRGVLFYLAAYGVMNAGVFAVLMLLPSKSGEPHTSAETYEDLAGTGRENPFLGLIMFVCCFSLIGLPLTIGFWGKLQLIWPVAQMFDHPKYGTVMVWLVVITMVNAAVSAGYYLRIIGAMFWRPEGVAETSAAVENTSQRGFVLPVVLAGVLSAFGTVLFGTLIPATEVLNNAVSPAVTIEAPTPKPELEPPVVVPVGSEVRAGGL
jgi:NADH-quinone oxidoreductase subunit N